MKKEMKKKPYVPPQVDILVSYLSDCCLQQASHRGQLNQFEDSGENIDPEDEVYENLGNGWNDNQGWI